MIRFITAAILTIIAIVGVASGMHFACAIGLVVAAVILVGWRFIEMEEQYLIN